MALQTLAFVLAFVPLATGHGYQKYISEYAGDYLKQFGKGSGYQDYIQTYAGMKSDAPKEAQAVSLMAADTSKGHTKKEDESAEGGGYQKYMSQYAGDYQKYMQGQGKGAQGGGQGGDYKKYMSNYGKDFEKYMQGQGKGSQGGDYQKYMSKYTGSYQKYMQGQKEGTQEKKEEDKDTETTPAFLFYAPLLLLSVAGMGSMYVECQRRAGRRQQPEGYLQLEADDRCMIFTTVDWLKSRSNHAASQLLRHLGAELVRRKIAVRFRLDLPLENGQILRLYPERGLDAASAYQQLYQQAAAYQQVAQAGW
ncbi:unnamed protein product [Durusdinium trenchii]|uniref:Uncharacterized protein n=1 Tax=Durusdinium trenchii TaxID=1381693 RepID=A0ABP0L9I4_9DINO